MVQPIHSRAFEGPGELDPSPPLSPPSHRSPSPQSVVRDASQIPDVSHLTGRSAGRTSGGLPSASSAAAGVVAAGPSPSAALAIQSRLDAFLAAAMPTYHTPDGDVQVSTPFRLAGAGPHEAGVQANGAAVRVVAMA